MSPRVLDNFAGKRQKEEGKSKTLTEKNILQERVGSSKNDFEQEPSLEINTHYGSDIRWEKEIEKKDKQNG